MDASSAQAGAPMDSNLHKRTKSSVLKSMMPRTHHRKPSSKDNHPDKAKHRDDDDDYVFPPNRPMLPPDHPHTRQHLREASGNGNVPTAPPRIEVEAGKRSENVLQERKKTTRSTSFKALIGKENAKATKKQLVQGDKKMTKSKSSTSISAILSRPRLSKETKTEDANRRKGKENETPPGSAGVAPPPIWAQFATQALEKHYNTTKIPLNDQVDVKEEMALYTPLRYSLSEQGNFQNNQQPDLSRKSEAKARPKSECMKTNHATASFVENISGLRKSTRDQSQANPTNQKQQSPIPADSNEVSVSEDRYTNARSSVEHRKVSNDSAGSGLTMPKRGSRVMAAVAAFNGKAKELPGELATKAELNPREIDSAFESLLDARNVPQNTRDKMRSLDNNIKANFIRQDKSGSESVSIIDGLPMGTSRPYTGNRSQTDDGTTHDAGETKEAIESSHSPKKSRPRSRTFTFSKGDQSPSKKQKSERPEAHQRTKSGDLTQSASSTSLASVGSAQGLAFLNRVSRPAVPEDYMRYLKRVQNPEMVEVGRVHKLRQLLRNETVGWVDTFITQGGMTELVELLYRIISVEWREEHEDNLLHETLLCLKALSTTSSAMRQLSDIQTRLFPTLLKLLFDEERKGPSEFTTRSTIITILSTYLADSSSSDLASRARTLLSYLRDPAKPEEAQPPGFITSIYHPRPYRLWHKELRNVTKEVFWIFLHHVNIVPYPQTSDTASSYSARHFPQEHPPVPAAPHIGGVEWDATNYLTANMDLLNGLIAALPTQAERNDLRQELKDSGFEKVMGISLRTCKEKFYGCVHEALSTWVGAAKEDGWPYQDVRQGPKAEDTRKTSPKKSPKKKDGPPKLEMPRLELGGADGKDGIDDGRWL